MQTPEFSYEHNTFDILPNQPNQLDISDAFVTILQDQINNLEHAFSFSNSNIDIEPIQIQPSYETSQNVELFSKDIPKVDLSFHNSNVHILPEDKSPELIFTQTFETFSQGPKIEQSSDSSSSSHSMENLLTESRPILNTSENIIIYHNDSELSSKLTLNSNVQELSIEKEMKEFSISEAFETFSKGIPM